MDILYASTISLLFVVISFTLHLVFYKSVKEQLPPGNTGWLGIGEILEFLGTGWKGHPEKFFFDRMAKYSPQVFRTSLMLEDLAVFCGSAGNKFLFSNEDKLVRLWWPSFVDKMFHLNQLSKKESIKFKTIIRNFLMPEALHRYVPVIDSLTQKHFENEWECKTQILTHELTKSLTFSLACKIFVGIDKPERVGHLSVLFKSIKRGLSSIPIDLPGTPFRRGINAAKLIRRELVSIMKQRKTLLVNANASPTQDLLSHLFLDSDEDMPETNIADKLMVFLLASHETTSSACACIVMFLAELPEIYQGVYTEQMKIANSKGSGDLLNWNDISKMKYSWNVACEALRVTSPAQGSFREAITDFVYNGYFIPKGRKLYWSAASTHKNPEYFPEPQKFDPSRFDGKGPAPYTFVPFGGGPAVCPGKEYARIEILVFMHHLVRKFKWEKVIPDEQIVVNAFPHPAKGLPIRLYPREA